jgi:hypothetical protein
MNDSLIQLMSNRDVHGQLLGIVNLQRPTDLLFRPYQEVMADFRSSGLMKLNAISTGAIRN